MQFDDQRKHMIQAHLIRRGIDDKCVLDAFSSVPREQFIPNEFHMHAYGDHPLSIGEGQTISQPYMVALMVELLGIGPESTVLEIGTGSGYQTAILAEIAKTVFTVERIDLLLRKARKVLKKLGYENIHFRLGDGSRGWEHAYPVQESFDAIVVSAASPAVPPTLTSQLAEGGVLVIPIGSRFMQQLCVIRKRDGELVQENHGGCTFVPLIGEEGW